VDKTRIRITRASIYRRRFADGFKIFFSKVADFIFELFGKPRYNRKATKPKGLPIRIGRGAMEESGLVFTEPLSISTSSSSGSNGGVIRIKPRPESNEENGSAIDRIESLTLRFSPKLKVPPQAQSKQRKNNISIRAGLEMCRACRQPFRPDDTKARCQVNPKHRVHKECVELMKNKCPSCGGQLT